MQKPSEHTINKVLNAKANRQEAGKVALWFTSKQGKLYLEETMDKDYKECELKNFDNIDFKEKKVLANINSKIRQNKKIKTLKKATQLVLPLALVLLILTLYLQASVDIFNTSKEITFKTAKGKSREIVFQDGTYVLLSPDSKITFPKKFKLRARTIQLEGEAYFKVEKSKWHPFVIDLGSSKIKVLGTSFKVDAYPDNILVKVILNQGSLAFKAKALKGKESILKSGETLRYHKEQNSINISQQDQKLNYTAGKDRLLNFNNDSLKTVLATLNRWHKVNFIVKDTSLYNYTFTTVFKNASLQDILNELQKVASLKFSEAENHITVEKAIKIVRN
ncbi:MAG: FecR family protein [Tenacibaculum sp.]